MGPKLLGGGASLLAAAFILTLPSIFKGEPADEVEPIRFGPPMVSGLDEAVRASTNTPTPLDPAPASIPPAPGPMVSSGGREHREKTAATPGGQGASVEGLRDDESRAGGAEESDDSARGRGEDGGDDSGEGGGGGDGVEDDGGMGEGEGDDVGDDDDDDPGGAEDDD